MPSRRFNSSRIALLCRLGLRVRFWGFKVLGLRANGLGLRISILRFMVYDLWFMVYGLWFMVSVFGLKFGKPGLVSVERVPLALHPF